MTAPASPNSATPRSPTESPRLWLLVILGSLVLHGAAFLGLRSWSLQQSETSPDANSIAIDLVEPQPNAVAPPPVSLPTRSAPPIASSPALASASTVTIAPSAKTPTTAISSKPRPAPKTAIATTTETRHPPATNSAPKLSQTTAKPTPDPATPETTADSETTATSNQSLPALPTVPNSATTPADTLPVPTSLMVQQNSRAAKFVVAIEILSTPVNLSFNRQPDAPKNPRPTPLEPSKTFTSDPSGCLLTPEAARYFGQPVEFTVQLDPKGTLQAENAFELQEPSGNDRYDELAACTLRTWSFQTVPDTAKGDRSSQFNVRVTIQPQ